MIKNHKAERGFYYENLPFPEKLRNELIDFLGTIKSCTNLEQMEKPEIGYVALCMSRLFNPLANHCRLNQRDAIESIYSLVDILLNDIFNIIKESGYSDEDKKQELRTIKNMLNFAAKDG